MGTSQLAVTGFRQSTLQGAIKAAGCQPAGDFGTTLASRPLHFSQALQHRRVFHVHPESHDVHRGAGPATGKLHPWDKLQVGSTGLDRLRRLSITGHGIVIGYRQHAYVITAGPLQQFLRSEGAVGGTTMAVEVDQHNLYTCRPDRAPDREPAGMILKRENPMLTARVPLTP